MPSTNQSLFVATKAATGAAASPFVVAITLVSSLKQVSGNPLTRIFQQVGIKVLNHIINAAILVFVLSAANSDLYIGSRTLYGLAVEGKAPSIFKRVNRMGVPYPALIMCTAFCCLVFLNVSSSSAKGNFCVTNLHLIINVGISQCLLGLLIWCQRSAPSRGCVLHFAICKFHRLCASSY